MKETRRLRFSEFTIRGFFCGLEHDGSFFIIGFWSKLILCIIAAVEIPFFIAMYYMVHPIQPLHAVIIWITIAMLGLLAWTLAKVAAYALYAMELSKENRKRRRAS